MKKKSCFQKSGLSKNGWGNWQRITAVARVDVPGTELEIHCFDKSEPNAFAMPGGKVGVNAGLIELAGEDEDEIAAVIGHEVAHARKEHSNKRYESGRLTALGQDNFGHSYEKQKLW